MIRRALTLLCLVAGLHLPAPPAAAQLGGLDALRSLGDGLTSAGGEEFLDPDRAFIVSALPDGAERIRVRWDIAEGYYLYRDKFSFVVAGGGATVGEPVYPPGDVEEDPTFGRVEVYRGTLELVLPAFPRDATVRELALTVGYQGCAEAGICYPPIKKTLPVLLTPTDTVPQAGITVSPAPPGGLPAPVSEQDGIAARLANQAGWVVLASFFGFGLLLAFTPCVFPMIPILSGILVGRGQHLTTRHAFGVSLVYVVAMAATYALAGVAAAALGKNLQAAFQHPYVLVAFASVFVGLALSMFGFYTLQLPGTLQSRVAAISGQQPGGSHHGAAVMGVLSAVIVGPCVAPPLAGALIYIGTSGDAWLGGAALFAMGLGMGAPLLLIGTSAGRWLPRAGVWMESVKNVFGVLMLGVAIWLLERILPGPVTLTLWALLLIVSAIYMGALDALESAASGWRRLWKGLGLAALLYGAVLMVGAAGGASDPLRPLVQFGIAGAYESTSRPALAFTPVKGVAGLEAELARASAGGAPVMLDFYADWCIECKRMERTTFTDAEVRRQLSGTRLLKADVTRNDEEDQALLKSLGLYGPPAILFFGPDAQEKRAHRLAGYLAPEAFRQHVAAALAP